ncbi:TPA: hypothetical protein ACXIJH_005247, partial [Serratia marcescens]
MNKINGTSFLNTIARYDEYNSLHERAPRQANATVNNQPSQGASQNQSASLTNSAPADTSAESVQNQILWNTYLNRAGPDAAAQNDKDNSIHKRTTRQADATVNSQPAQGASQSQSTSFTNPMSADTSAQLIQNQIIWNSDQGQQPDPNFTLGQRERNVEQYAARIKQHLDKVQGSGSEAQKNVDFLNARLFMRPDGYFSAGLLAAGIDPNDEVNVKYNSYVGFLNNKRLDHTSDHTYKAWEVAAGRVAHDEPGWAGPINTTEREMTPEAQNKIALYSKLGEKLQNSWNTNILANYDAGELAIRSGKADAYSVKATLQSLTQNPEAAKTLSPESMQAIRDTLDNKQNVIIPNVYGYPMRGYAFISNKPYNGDYTQRPNQGVLINLERGVVTSIKNDADFANLVKDNKAEILQSFNSINMQGGMDAHWAKPEDVINSVIKGEDLKPNDARMPTYPGYNGLLSDKAIPANQLFNYTLSRGSEYQLKTGSLDPVSGKPDIAQAFQEMNKKNLSSDDQTQVFGKSQQNWKTAENIWNNTFGYLPGVGNAGNIVFGAHNSLYGMTAGDRIGGTAGAVIAGLQLGHDIASGIAGGIRPGSVAKNSVKTDWLSDPKTGELKLSIVSPKAGSSGGITASFGGIEQLPEGATRKPGSLGIYDGGGKEYVKIQNKWYEYEKRAGQHTIKDPKNAGSTTEIKSLGDDNWKALPGAGLN